jgi:Flp pilus assembly protein TadG
MEISFYTSIYELWDMLSRKIKRHRRNGVAAVEAAILLPTCVLLVLGTIEICSMIFLKQSLEIAAYEGARTAIVPKSLVGHVTFKSDTILTNRSVVGATVTVTPANFNTMPYGTIIKVSIAAPCDSNSLFPAMFFAGQTMTGEVEMMKES